MGAPERRTLLFRLIVEAPSAEGAEAVQREVVPQLTPLATVEAAPVKRYPKFPDTWQLVLYLDPKADDAFAVFDRLTALARAGWLLGEAAPGEDRWAVWNPADAERLLHAAVTWVCLETWIRPTETGPVEPVLPL